jgi:hypothetical protein
VYTLGTQSATVFIDRWWLRLNLCRRCEEVGFRPRKQSKTIQKLQFFGSLDCTWPAAKHSWPKAKYHKLVSLKTRLPCAGGQPQVGQPSAEAEAASANDGFFQTDALPFFWQPGEEKVGIKKPVPVMERAFVFQLKTPSSYPAFNSCF